MKQFFRVLVIPALFVLLVGGSAIVAHGQGKFSKGDKVEVTDTDEPGKWVKGTVILFDDDGGYGHRGQYSVQVDGKPYNYSGWRKPGEIRRAGQAPREDTVETPTAKFKARQQVEVIDTDNPGKWVRGTVILFDDDGAYGHKGQYSVQVDGKPPFYNGWRKGNEIRSIGAAGPIRTPPVDDPPVDTPPIEPPDNDNAGPLKVGDRVDVYLLGGKEGKNRGTILEINGNKIKVHPDGCAPYWDREQDANLVRRAATISATAQEIRFLIGKWSMTMVGVTTQTTAWGTTAGIQINGDGSFVWYQDGGRARVKGRWEPHAKIPNTQFGTEVLSGLLIKDAKGQLWKITKRISPLDNGDHITATLMCSGENVIGTRVR